MTPLQIETMIDRMCGMFPTVPVPRNGMKLVWREDAVLLNVDVAEGRAVMALVEKHGTVPSLPEIKNMFRKMTVQVSEGIRCEHCDNTGWTYFDETNFDLGVRECNFCR